MKERIVGILGGKGPEATVELLKLIIKHTPVAQEEDHLRIIVDNNPKIPKPSQGITGEGADPVTALTETARNLERACADFIAIPCNSAHYYLDNIRQAVTIPVLDIIEETAAALKRCGIHKVGLLATTGLIQSELYQQRLSENSIAPIVPEASSQIEMMTRILQFKNGGSLLPLTKICRRICSDLINQDGVDAVAYACTEVPIALADHRLNVTAFDTLDILAWACIREARAKPARQE